MPAPPPPTPSPHPGHPSPPALLQVLQLEGSLRELQLQQRRKTAGPASPGRSPLSVDRLRAVVSIGDEEGGVGWGRPGGGGPAAVDGSLAMEQQLWEQREAGLTARACALEAALQQRAAEAEEAARHIQALQEQVWRAGSGVEGQGRAGGGAGQAYTEVDLGSYIYYI